MGIQNRLKIGSANGERSSLRAFLIFRNRQQRRLLAQAFDVGARCSFQMGSKLVDVHVRCERDAPGTESQNRRTVRSAGFGERKDIVKPSAAQERRFYALGTIGGCQQEHAFYVAQVVNFAQELAENPLINVRTQMIGAELWRERIDSVKEQDARRGAPRFFEHFAERAL